MSTIGLIKATESLKKREGDLLPTLKAVFFEELKNRYDTIKIKDALIESKGGSWGNDYYKDGIKVKVLRSPDIRFGFIDYENAEERYFTKKEVENFNLKDNDILVIKSNGSLDLVGKSQIYKTNKSFPFVIASNFLMVLSPNTKKVYPEYFDLFLKSPQSLVWRFDTQKTTTGLRNLNSKGFLEIEIPVPPTISDQIRLYNSFSRFIKGEIEEDEREIKKTYNLAKYKTELTIELTHQQDIVKQLRQAFLREAMQGKLVIQNKEDGNACDLLNKIKEEKVKNPKKEKPLPTIKKEEIPFEIPENWLWCKLGEIISYTENLDIQKRFLENDLINYVDIDSIDNQKQIIREIKQRKVSELSTRARRVLRKNYIMYSTVRPYLKNIAIIENDLPNFIGSTGFNVFKTIEVSEKFVFYFLLSPEVNETYKNMMIGFNSPSISNEQFENTLIPLPPLSEQHRIVKRLEQLMQFCDDLEKNIQESKEQTQMLLQSALSDTLEEKEPVSS